MKKSIFALTICCGLFSFVSCNKNNGKVTEEEWKEAIENIVNYKKSNKLNYIAEGDVVSTYQGEGYSDQSHLKKVEANDNISAETNNDGKRDTTDFYVKDGMFYFEINEHYFDDKPEYSFGVSDFGAPEIFNHILDIYDYQSYFNFTNNKYITKDDKSYVPGCKFHLELTFKDKKIKELYFDYEFYDSSEEETVKFNGSLTFNYGTSTLSESSIPASINWQDEKAKKFSVLNDSNNYAVPNADLTNSSVVQINVGEKIDSKKTLMFKDNNDKTLYPFSSDKEYKLVVYKNKTKLTKGNDAISGDYYLSDPNPSYSTNCSKLIFNTSLANNDSIELKVEYGFGGFVNSKISLT